MNISCLELLKTAGDKFGWWEKLPSVAVCIWHWHSIFFRYELREFGTSFLKCVKFDLAEISNFPLFQLKVEIVPYRTNRPESSDKWWPRRAGSSPGCLGGTARSCCRRSSSTSTLSLSTPPARFARAGMTSSESQSGALREDTELWRGDFTTTGSARTPGSPVATT